MSTKYQMQIAKDLSQKKIVISRDFDTDLPALWKAYTDSSTLDQWWAPRPWKAATKSMDFREGGHWLYAMVSPEGEKHWGKVLYGRIVPQASFIADDMFCDEQGNPDTEMPRMHWFNEFSATRTGARITSQILFASESDMKKILDMGFEQGIAIAADGLEELLATS